MVNRLSADGRSGGGFGVVGGAAPVKPRVSVLQPLTVSGPAVWNVRCRAQAKDGHQD
jgi:hypothetical protein